MKKTNWQNLLSVARIALNNSNKLVHYAKKNFGWEKIPLAPNSNWANVYKK